MSEPPEQAQKNIAHALEKIDILLKYWEETQATLEAISPYAEDISDSIKMQTLKEACGALRTRCTLYGKEVSSSSRVTAIELICCVSGREMAGYLLCMKYL
jgi:hypothetical protein